MSKKGSVDRMIDDAVIQHNYDLLEIIANLLDKDHGGTSTEDDAFADEIYYEISLAFEAERKKITNRFED